VIEFRKWNEIVELVMPAIDEMMENHEAALNSGILNLIDFAISLSMRGRREGGAEIAEARRERYKKLEAYMKKLEEPAARTVNRLGTLYTFAVAYTNEYLREALEQEINEAEQGMIYIHTTKESADSESQARRSY